MEARRISENSIPVAVRAEISARNATPISEVQVGADGVAWHSIIHRGRKQQIALIGGRFETRLA